MISLSKLIPESVHRTLKGSTIKRHKNVVGKQVGKQLYVHKEYATEVVPPDMLKRALEVLAKNAPEFQYNCIMWDSGRPIVRFDQAPDFDTAREPHVGDFIVVDPRNPTFISRGHSDSIWHHKWLWVKDNYSGFDVKQSKKWSKMWLSKLEEPAKGTDVTWNMQLNKVGLNEGAKVPEFFGLGQIGGYGEVQFKFIPSHLYRETQHGNVFQYSTNLRFRFHYTFDKHHGMVYWGAHPPDEDHLNTVENFFHKNKIQIVQRDFKLNVLREAVKSIQFSLYGAHEK